MAKYFLSIGFEEMTQPSRGVYVENITEKQYYGEIMRNYRSLVNSGYVNDGINISNQISILADPYAINNFHSMRYAIFQGSKWKISNVEVQTPRLILTLGGLYNG